MLKTKAAESSALQKALARPIPAEIASLTAKLKTARANFETVRRAEDEYRRARAGNNVDELASELARAETRGDVARRIDGEIPSELAAEIERLRKDLVAAQAARDGRAARLTAFGEEIDRRRESINEARLELHAAISAWTEAALGAADAQLAVAARLIAESYGVAEELKRETNWRYPSSLMGIAGTGSHETNARLELPAEISTATHEARLAFGIVTRP